MPKKSTWTQGQIDTLMHLRDDLKMRWVDIAKELGRSKTACALKWDVLTYPVEPHSTMRVDAICVPEAVLSDRDQRYAAAPRDLTAFLLGDPTVGYSALDEKQRVTA